jgi:DNA mismatch repair protein MLH1
MFYNVPARRKAFKAGQEEYNLVKELIQRYAVYCAPGVSFTLKRQGETRSELHTLASATRLDVIRSLWGAEVAGKLLPLEAQQGGSVGPEVRSRRRQQ